MSVTEICRNWRLSFCQQQTEQTDDEISPYAIKDVDEDEEECDEHCHPESESETSASCINVQKNIVEDCQ